MIRVRAIGGPLDGWEYDSPALRPADLPQQFVTGTIRALYVRSPFTILGGAGVTYHYQPEPTGRETIEEVQDETEERDV